MTLKKVFRLLVDTNAKTCSKSREIGIYIEMAIISVLKWLPLNHRFSNEKY